MTITGAPGILPGADLPAPADGVIVMNAGHFPHEIEVDACLCRGTGCARPTGSTTITLADGRRIHVSPAGTW